MPYTHDSDEIIRLEHATVRRGSAHILDDVSLTLRHGEHAAIIGPNGAGKSTLMNVISRDCHPLAKDDYHLYLFGREKWLQLELKKHIGIVSQSLSSWCSTSYSAEEIVVSGLYSAIGLDFHHTVKDEDYEKAWHEMERVGIMVLKDKPMMTLSSGEKERVLLARAAVTDPELLLLDEASIALDFPSRADLRKSIRSYASEGKTILMVTHEASEIIPEINRVIILKDGRIFKDGTKEECLTGDVLSEVYGTKVYVDRHDGLYNVWC